MTNDLRLIFTAMNDYYVYIITNKDKTKLDTGLAGELSISLRKLDLKPTTGAEDIWK